MTRVKWVVAFLTAALGFTGLMAAPASGAVDALQCTSTGRICMWEDVDANDENPDMWYGAWSRQVTYIGDAANDEASSVWNRYSQAWVLYRNLNFSDPILCVMPHPNDRHVVNLTNWFNVNDQVSSFRRTGSASASSCPRGIPIAY